MLRFTFKYILSLFVLMESFSFNQKRKLQKYQVDLRKDNMGFQNLLSMLNGHSWFGSIPLNFQLEIVFEHGIDN